MLCADFHAGFACRNNSFRLLKQKVLLVETNGFPKGNSQFLLLKAIIGGLAKVSYKLVPHRGCTFVGYVVQQVPDAPCNPALQGFPEMRAVGGIGRDTVRIDDA